MRVTTGLIICAALAAPDVASACRRSPDPGTLMSRDYATVAIVRIEDVIPTTPSRPELEWRAMATRVSVVAGAEPALNLQLGHAEIPNCRERRPAPRTGEYWVAYIEGIGGPDSVVYNTWPLDFARSLDPRFSGAPAR
ncbi:MAG: hypothetical protein EOP17_06655 [Rhizobiaceae bacterium]|nr:MAG: hypothetical protein EOP17_06655 [Rhizobiaceae bacterium]